MKFSPKDYQAMLESHNSCFVRLTSSFILRREPFYHKLQYSKTPKFDVAAPALGAISGAFVAYMALATLGTAGADLSDLVTVA